MRLLSLHLERYGAFTDRTLAFRPDARLHVVLGANEAGKSTALSAVTDLLFGFGKTTAYAFQHEMPLLRIGAEIASADGRRLAFRRRKGNARTLIDADEAPLPDDALAPFLGGLVRPVFCRAFGLDAEALRRGGREMVDVEGEVGASLFAAGSGLRGLTELQARLDGEAEAIFTPRKAGHRTFYQALDRWQDSRKTERETGISTADWRQLNEAIAAAGADLDALRAERGRLAAARARLERLKRAGPVLAEIDALEARLAEDPLAVEADGAWVARLGEVLAECRAAEADSTRAGASLSRARAEVEALPQVAPLAERTEEILEAFRGIGRFEKDGTDLTRLRGEAERAEQTLDRLCARVGVRGRDALADILPTDAARAGIERLVREGRALDAAETQVTREAETARAERDRLIREGEAAGSVLDPAPLREMLRPFGRLRETIARHREFEDGIRRAVDFLRDRAGRLSPAIADPASLARTPLPSAEAIGRFQALLDEAARERGRVADRLAAARRRVAEIRARLDEREAAGPVATQERLAALRAARAGAFAPLRDALVAGTGASPDAVAAFERTVEAADRLADARADDATRVAAHAADQLRLAAALAEVAEDEESLTAREADVAEGEAAWQEAWREAGIRPGPPVEMTRWLAEAQAVIGAEQDLADERISRDRYAAEIAAAREPLAALCVRAGMEVLPGLDPAALLDGLEGHLRALATRWEAGREAIGRLGAARQAAERQEAALTETAARRAVWREAWAGAVTVLALPATAGLEEAEGALAAWREVPQALAQHADLTRRVKGLIRDRDLFQSAAASLVADLAPDLADMTPGAGIRTLHNRLQAAQAEAVRRTELCRLQEAAGQAAAEAARGGEAARGRLAALVGERLPEAAGASPDELVSLHGRLDARERLRADLARLRMRGLAVAGDGLPEAELRAGLAETPPEAIEAGLAALAAEAEEVEDRSRVVYSDRERDIGRRAELEGGTGAELALAERKGAEAQMQEAARSWAVLRLAGLMLGAAVAKHRAGQQDPMLARAGTLFQRLTGGGFEGLAQSYDEADTPRLVGRRASGPAGGGLVSIEAMSEGTRDQLYLALRLAHLEDYAGRAEPAPFVGDDLFSTFDDARTAHGLETLAEIGGSVQPILFTHHRHVADIAAARLGSAVDVLTL
ncbi:YhaN family protein [Methylobacterium sp. J-076]|uniref:YhaN family protein n=1 Tax=Methylobacterium sp. J-076 TaxID=2836655 RepID=UPI002443B274|nr:YhaN family protein [Methylobacterium sp. J-076]